MDDETTGFNFDMEGMPDWFVELIDRLMQVFTKLMIKLGLKIAL